MPADTRPRRRFVVRPNGERVNVPRLLGHLFVCAQGCCCGQVEGGQAPVPTELYHQEWERRGWRNRVHLTIGGCLGPCALANVLMLVFDGETRYFQSVNDDALVLTLLDHVDAMLEAGHFLPLPAPLAPLAFTRFTWDEPRERQ